MSARRIAASVIATAAIVATSATAASALPEEQACSLSGDSYVLCALATYQGYGYRANNIVEASGAGVYGVIYQYEADEDYWNSWGTGAYVATDDAEVDASHGGTDSEYFGNDRHTYARVSVWQRDNRTDVGAGVFNWDSDGGSDGFLHAGVTQEGNGYSRYSGLWRTADDCSLSAPDMSTMSCGAGGVPSNPDPIPFLPLP